MLVDRYDMAITEKLGRFEVPDADDILDVMRALYGALKAQRDCIRYTFMTGITRFARTVLFSGANHFDGSVLQPGGQHPIVFHASRVARQP